MPSFKTTITIPVEVEYQLHPASDGSREDRTGLAMEPGTPAFCEILRVNLSPDWWALFASGIKPHLLPEEIAKELHAEAMEDASE